MSRQLVCLLLTVSVARHHSVDVGVRAEVEAGHLDLLDGEAPLFREDASVHVDDDSQELVLSSD